jgi:hypothetical protein
VVNHGQFFGGMIAIAAVLLGMAASERRSTAHPAPGPAVLTGVLAALLGAIGSAAALLSGSDAVWLFDGVLGVMLVGLLAQGIGLLWWAVRDQPRPRARNGWATLLLVLVVAAAVTTWRWLPSSKAARFLPQYRRHLVHVEGTCLNDACGLRQHIHPRSDSPRRGGLISDGEPIEVICQRFGGRVTSRRSRRSELWDLMPNKLWVSDLFVSTSKRGLRSRELPPCPVSVG